MSIKEVAISLTIVSAAAIGTQAVFAQTTTPPSASPTTKQEQKLAQQQANQQQRITNAKQKADTEIDRRVTSLNDLTTRINNIKRLSTNNKSTLSSQVQTEISNLTTLKTKIDADTDINTLKTDIQSIVNSYRVYLLYIPRVHIVTGSDLVLQAVDKFTDIENRLQSKITDAQNAGKDVSSLNNSLSDMKSKVADASTQANNAVNAVMPLQPSANTQDYKPTLQNARSMLQTAVADLHAARNDAQTIIQGLKQMGRLNTSSPSATQK